MFDQTLAFSIIRCKWMTKDKGIINEEVSVEILKILDVIYLMNDYFKKYRRRKHNSII